MNESQKLRLPIFPLQAVLFPTVPINLHIFEPRYQQMINRCIDEKSPFGVVLIKEGDESLGPVATPYLTGCSAEIIHVEKLSEGRMNITAIGKKRFYIQSTQKDLPYLTGSVSIMPFIISDQIALKTQTTRLQAQVEKYIDLLSKAMTKPITTNFLPADPLAKIYLSASILQIPLIEKQKLLEINDGLQLVRSMRSLFNREIALLQIMIQQKGKSQGKFGLN